MCSLKEKFALKSINAPHCKIKQYLALRKDGLAHRCGLKGMKYVKAST